MHLYCVIFWTKITYKGGSSSDWAPLWDLSIICDICTNWCPMYLHVQSHFLIKTNLLITVKVYSFYNNIVLASKIQIMHFFKNKLIIYIFKTVIFFRQSNHIFFLKKKISIYDYEVIYIFIKISLCYIILKLKLYIS